MNVGGGPDPEIEDPDPKIDVREETRRAEMVDPVAINKILFLSIIKFSFLLMCLFIQISFNS